MRFNDSCFHGPPVMNEIICGHFDRLPGLQILEMIQKKFCIESIGVVEVEIGDIYVGDVFGAFIIIVLRYEDEIRHPFGNTFDDSCFSRSGPSGNTDQTDFVTHEPASKIIFCS